MGSRSLGYPTWNLNTTGARERILLPYILFPCSPCCYWHSWMELLPCDTLPMQELLPCCHPMRYSSHDGLPVASDLRACFFNALLFNAPKRSEHCSMPRGAVLLTSGVLARRCGACCNSIVGSFLVDETRFSFRCSKQGQLRSCCMLQVLQSTTLDGECEPVLGNDQARVPLVCCT